MVHERGRNFCSRFRTNGFTLSLHTFQSVHKFTTSSRYFGIDGRSHEKLSPFKRERGPLLKKASDKVLLSTLP
jgi:hypothetical protein